MGLRGYILLICITLGNIYGFRIDPVCDVKVNGDLPDPEPLILMPGSSNDGLSFFLPDPEGMVVFQNGEEIRLACTGFNNTIDIKMNSMQDDIIAKCVSENTFMVNNIKYDFHELKCNRLSDPTARFSSNECYNGHNEIQIGFEVKKDFFTLITVCWDAENLNALYSTFIMGPGIAGFESGYHRPYDFNASIFYGDIDPATLFKRPHQRDTVSKILGSNELGEKYISDDSDYYLARGHLTANADFVYRAEHTATFFYVNVAPQWQTFNGQNWEKLEESIRGFVGKYDNNVNVYTGTHEIATLPDVNGQESELYLYYTEERKGIPVPRYYWKVIHDADRQKGTAFIGVNNPYANIDSSYIFCTDICSEINWLKWDQKNINKGYSYCCEINDFKKSVKTLPNLDVTNGILK